MRVTEVVSAVFLIIGLVVPESTQVFAAAAAKVTKVVKKTPKKDRSSAKPSLPSGGASTPGSGDAVGAADPQLAITSYRNELGDTVYAVAASWFDVSPPLRDMAESATSSRSVGEEEEEDELSHPVLPSWRIPRSDLPDPVVQPAVSPDEFLRAGGIASAAPTTGFNFVGIGVSGGSPSDSNGSVGNNQYVETVNIRYQVWSLDRANKIATSILGPSNINTLWTGFGGPCQTQNSGDPIVLYDKLANRWLISQFTTGVSGGSYYQCVAVSTTPDATGTYARWAFAVPAGRFGDYPHFGVWTDAYYMMGHAFQSTAGGYVAAMFAAMDRKKMLDGDPTATWQVILDPAEGGHMPADLDGFTPPPTDAPGIFLSLHSSGMFVYRMKVDFDMPANTVRTKQATVPVAPADAACGGGSCLPQPGTSVVLDSLADRLMFRVAYRNFVDHESLVVSHSVDPSVAGVVSGVRWYDFRLSGTPDSVCSSYPCVYQQGTVADVANGRSRWMSSIAMDSAENILVGYSTTGKTAGTENQSLRYTGRAKGDPPGTMTAPEAIIATGTQNNTSNRRWGDYSSMSLDPFDDCTFWYVGQYIPISASAWGTKIASAAFPAGSGAGQCLPSTCTSRPDAAPTIGPASVPGDNQITVTWTGIAPQPGSYAIERAEGVCGSEGLYQPLGAASGTAGSFTDTTVQGGLNYSYRVIAATDAAGKCQALVASDCVSATATGTCSLKPSFAGADQAGNSQQSFCGVTVAWTPAVSGCPLTPGIRYNVFRGTVPDFVPSPANRIATCVVGPSSYLDSASLTSGATYYYVVRAEDVSQGHGGECAGGNAESNSTVVSGTAYGPGLQAGPGTWTDGGGDGSAFLSLNVAGGGNTSDAVWRFVKTAHDPGANHTPGGAYAYRNAGPAAASTYAANVCAEMQAPPLTVGATTVHLQYWERHQIEYHWDAVAVEYSVNGGAFTDVPPPSNSVAAGCAASDDTTGWEPLSCTMNPPINVCGYGTTKLAFNGPFGGGTTCNDFATSAITPYARRCHPITGLVGGDAIRFRWRFSSDPGAEFAGFYLDDIAVTNIRLPNVCAPDTCGAAAPAEISGVHANGHPSTTLTWSALPGGVTYDVASSTLSELRVNGTGTAACLTNNVGVAGTVDGRADPAPGDGYYYIVRAQSACGSGSYGTSSLGAPRAPVPGCA